MFDRDKYPWRCPLCLRAVKLTLTVTVCFLVTHLHRLQTVTAASQQLQTGL